MRLFLELTDVKIVQTESEGNTLSFHPRWVPLIINKKCRQECKKSCPVVRTGKLCIEVTPDSKISFISERLCIGCGICPKKCPFGAIHIINLPTNLESQVTHRYSANSFKLHRLPMPRPGQVLGLVGTNGIGKSTALKILSGKLKPNLGRYEDPPDWEEILKYFRGSELQSASSIFLTLNKSPFKSYSDKRRLFYQSFGR